MPENDHGDEGLRNSWYSAIRFFNQASLAGMFLCLSGFSWICLSNAFPIKSQTSTSSFGMFFSNIRSTESNQLVGIEFEPQFDHYGSLRMSEVSGTEIWGAVRWRQVRARSNEPLLERYRLRSGFHPPSPLCTMELSWRIV